MITLQQFVDKWLGKEIDYDGFYGGQCVDLYRQYVKEVLEYPQSPGVGGAAEIWDTASSEHYDFIKNDPLAVPNPGDIVIFNRRVGGGFGHVSIFLEGDVNSFTSLDQNWPTLGEVTKTSHNYNSVIGWLRPKKNATGEKTYTQEEWDKLKHENQDNWDKWQAAEKTIEALNKQLVVAKDTHQEFVEGLIIKLAPDHKKYEGVEKEKIIEIEIDNLISYEDKLKDAEKEIKKKEAELTQKENNWKAEIQELRSMLDKANNRIDQLEEDIDKSKQEKAQNSWLSELISGILDKLRR